METTEKNLICCPACRSVLVNEEKSVRKPEIPAVFTCPGCGLVYARNNGYIDFMTPNSGICRSRRFRIMQSLYAVWYTPLTNFCFLPCGGARNARIEVLSHLEIPENALILETGIGTGDNLPYLAKNNGHATVYGIDIQDRMLRNCTRTAGKLGMKTVLYKADAEYLPFRDNSFSTVFHVGAINLFCDKKRAIEEMIRVAKPGTKIVIADESEKGACFFKFFTGEKEVVVPPVDLVPREMEEIRLEKIWRGFGYLIRFRKPSA